MKWQTPKKGDKRVIKKFLLFPLILNGEKRWLEWTTISQEFSDKGYWVSIQFID